MEEEDVDSDDMSEDSSEDWDDDDDHGFGLGTRDWSGLKGQLETMKTRVQSELASTA